jgi:2-methylcitrate dehydratase PrpD
MSELQTGDFQQAVGRFRTLRLGDLPAEALAVARHCLLDWLGCALAGTREPLSAILRDEIGGTAGEASLIGGGRAAARDAALVNGAAGHALDFDDTHTGMGGHPTAPVLPAALALAESRGATGAALLAAFVAGLEVECRLGLYMGAEHYRLGWHSTGTLGTVGAAAAAAHLLELDETRWRQALGIAATQAAGLKASFGTMAKPLHAGNAARNGLFAAQIAARGFVGAPDAIDAPQGLAAAAANGRADAEKLHGAGDRFLIIDTLFKYHAACYLTHAGINAASSLRGAIEPAVIESVELRVNPSLLSVCAIPEPRTGLELKFSLRGTTAMALLGVETADLASFSDAQARDAALVRLRDRVRLVTDPSLASTRAIVSVAGQGEQRRAEYDSGLPERDLGRQWQRLLAKFRGLATPIIGARAAEHVIATVATIEQADSLKDLLALTAPAPSLV